MERKPTRSKFSEYRIKDIKFLFLDESLFKRAGKDVKKLVRSFVDKALTDPLQIVPKETLAAEHVFLHHLLPMVWKGKFCLSGKLAYRCKMFDIYEELHEMGLAEEVWERNDLKRAKTDRYYRNNPSFSEGNFLERWKPVMRKAS